MSLKIKICVLLTLKLKEHEVNSTKIRAVPAFWVTPKINPEMPGEVLGEAETKLFSKGWANQPRTDGIALCTEIEDILFFLSAMQDCHWIHLHWSILMID